MTKMLLTDALPAGIQFESNEGTVLSVEDMRGFIEEGLLIDSVFLKEESNVVLDDLDPKSKVGEFNYWAYPFADLEKIILMANGVFTLFTLSSEQDDFRQHFLCQECVDGLFGSDSDEHSRLVTHYLETYETVQLDKNWEAYETIFSCNCCTKKGYGKRHRAIAVTSEVEVPIVFDPLEGISMVFIVPGTATELIFNSGKVTGVAVRHASGYDVLPFEQTDKRTISLKGDLLEQVHNGQNPRIMEAVQWAFPEALFTISTENNSLVLTMTEDFLAMVKNQYQLHIGSMDALSESAAENAEVLMFTMEHSAAENRKGKLYNSTSLSVLVSFTLQLLLSDKLLYEAVMFQLSEMQKPENGTIN